MKILQSRGLSFAIVSLYFFLSSGAVAQGDEESRRCVSVTPLPSDLNVEKQIDGVPPELARFLGVWSGSWNGAGCGTLAVTSVKADGAAMVVYSWDPKWGGSDNPLTIEGKIDDGELVIYLRGRTEVTYEFTSPDVLKGTYYRNGKWTNKMRAVTP